MPVTISPHLPILLLDSDSDSRMISERMFARSALKNPILTFAAGEDMLEYIDKMFTQGQSMPAALVVDMQLPSAAGFDVLTKIRMDDRLREVPVVSVFGAADRGEDFERALHMGANTFVLKPEGIDCYQRFIRDTFHPEAS